MALYKFCIIIIIIIALLFWKCTACA